ncbi:MAG: LytTR family DNA-binding domain-containing protein [Balneola sp.]
MNFRKTTLYFTAFVLFIILFDAFQQQYYLTTYDIVDGGDRIPFSELFMIHSIRWIVWGICSIPLAIIAWKKFSVSDSDVSTSNWFQISATGFFSWMISILVVSMISILRYADVITVSNILETTEFFVFQKGITFLFAYCVLVLTLYSNAKNIVIDAQWVEIKDLKSNPALNSDSTAEPQVSIKIGNKLKLIPLAEVTWIESDDYCVKIHTEQKAYSLRKSLKSLEEQLAPYNFIRVHRGALLNLGYLDQVDFESSMVKLQDSSELPLSKSGAQILRKVLKASSI